MHTVYREDNVPKASRTCTPPAQMGCARRRYEPCAGNRTVEIDHLMAARSA